MRDCGDCGAKPGDLHDQGCDVERCALCGGQAISCSCVYELNGMDGSFLQEEHPDIYHHGPTREMCDVLDRSVKGVGGRLPWEGIWPGTRECEEYGWYSRWVSCKTGNPIDFSADESGKWEKCAKEDPGAGPDFNRLWNWDPKQRRYVR